MRSYEADFEVLNVIVDHKRTLISIVGHSHTLSAYIVMFRGTCPTSFQNWVTDLSFSKLDANYPGASL